MLTKVSKLINWLTSSHQIIDILINNIPLQGTHLLELR